MSSKISFKEQLTDKLNDSVNQARTFPVRRELFRRLFEDNDFSIGHDSGMPPGGGEPAKLHPDHEPPGEDSVNFPLSQYLGERLLTAA